ncbi:MAG: hypothetical protein LBM56_02055, partial [Burkholderiaceae bacterium]|nr:hypothetical protein [Burkholderiaceae bacterium]
VSVFRTGMAAAAPAARPAAKPAAKPALKRPATGGTRQLKAPARAALPPASQAPGKAATDHDDDNWEEV